MFGTRTVWCPHKTPILTFDSRSYVALWSQAEKFFFNLKISILIFDFHCQIFKFASCNYATTLFISSPRNRSSWLLQALVLANPKPNPIVDSDNLSVPILISLSFNTKHYIDSQKIYDLLISHIVRHSNIEQTVILVLVNFWNRTISWPMIIIRSRIHIHQYHIENMQAPFISFISFKFPLFDFNF
jgi:hypothetical protein